MSAAIQQNADTSSVAGQAAWQHQQGGQQQGTQQTTTNSVSMELMAKLQRQKDAKDKAELAEHRRRAAMLAAERAEEEYRLACEAERQATEAASGTAPTPINSLIESCAVQGPCYAAIALSSFTLADR